MTTKLISTLAVLAAVAVAPAGAIAAEPAPAPVTPPSASANGIIAVLIGLAHAQPFTPPIGTDKGSLVGTR